jgi:hypothetical protein
MNLARLPNSRLSAPLSPVKYWEIIADNLSKAGWSWGCVSAIDSEGRTIWIVDAHRGNGQHFIVRADEKLAAFLELKSETRGEVATSQTPRNLPGDRAVTVPCLRPCLPL